MLNTEDTMTDVNETPSQLPSPGWTIHELAGALEAFRRADIRNAPNSISATEMPMPEPLDEVFARVETFVAALEYRGQGRSIVTCPFGHEANCVDESGEYVPLHVGDLRDLVNAAKRLLMIGTFE